jgi:hypothetical protein
MRVFSCYIRNSLAMMHREFQLSIILERNGLAHRKASLQSPVKF